MKSSIITVKLSVKDLLLKVGIDKPHHLWKELGGSKSTPKTLLEGTVEGIHFNSMERILDITRKKDTKLFSAVTMHLNASGLFEVSADGEPAKEGAGSTKK